MRTVDLQLHRDRTGRFQRACLNVLRALVHCSTVWLKYGSRCGCSVSPPAAVLKRAERRACQGSQAVIAESGCGARGPIRDPRTAAANCGCLPSCIVLVVPQDIPPWLTEGVQFLARRLRTTSFTYWPCGGVGHLKTPGTLQAIVANLRAYTRSRGPFATRNGRCLHTSKVIVTGLPLTGMDLFPQFAWSPAKLC